MHKSLIPLAALGLALLIGCEQTETTLYLNPDGSGKLLYTATYPLDVESPDLGNAKPRTDEQKVAGALKNVLGKSVGVDAWSDVSCTATPDGLILFKGTAYFRDLAALKIGSLAEGNSGPSVNLECKKTPKGYRLAVINKKDKPEARAPGTNAPATREARLQAVRRARTSWKYMRPMLGVMIGNDVRTYTVVAPKPAKSVQGFAATKDGYTFTYDGAKLLKAMDDFFAKGDDELAALADKVELKDSQALTSYIAKQFCIDPQSGAVLEIEADTPQFDYAKEVAAARPSFAALCAKAGITAQDSAGKPVVAPAAKGTIKSVHVKSISRSFPENENERPRTSVGLSVVFDGAVTSLGQTAITEVIDATGKPVAPKDLSCNGSLSQNKASCTLDCNLPAELSGIGRLSGTLAYTVGTGSKIVDLGIMETREGAKGAELEAEIKSVRTGWLELKFKGEPAMVKAFQVLAPDGQPYKVSEFSLNGWQGYCTKMFRPGEGDKWPEKLLFKVELFTESKSFTAPWSVQDIALPQAGK